MNLFAFATEFNRYFTAGSALVEQLRSSGRIVTGPELAVLLEGQCAAWDPVVDGVRVFGDAETKKAGCRMLAGILIAIADKRK